MFCRRTAHLLLAILVIVPAVAAQGPNLIAGPNVNMVSGTTWPDGDPFLQRQNEPSIAVSTRNPMHIMAASNDYRTVDLPGLPEGLPIADSWIGVYQSLDGGGSWTSTLLPCYPHESGPPASPRCVNSPIAGLQAAADPVVRAGTHGMFYLTGIVFDRGETPQSKLFVARYVDLNNDPHKPIQYIDTVEVASYTFPSNVFIDKPWMAVDIPRNGATCGNVYLAWAEIESSGDTVVESRILFSTSADCGATWDAPTQISGSGTINQGATVAVAPDNGNVYVAWRQLSGLGVGEDCGREPGDWLRTPPEDWPIHSLLLGGVLYDQAHLVDILSSPGSAHGDARFILGWQLIAAKLNQFHVIDPNGAGIVMHHADEWLADWPIFGPKKPKKDDKSEGTALADQLKLYNAGLLGPIGCSAIPGSTFDDAIMVTASSAGGVYFDPPKVVRPLQPFEAFDQATTEWSFRTTAYPTITVDGEGRVYIAWTERGEALPTGNNDSTDGDSRVMVGTSLYPFDSLPWADVHPIDQPEVPGHQIQPSITTVNDRLFLVYNDFRNDYSGVFDRFVVDYLTPVQPYRHTVDVRAAVANPGPNPVFTDYSIISGSSPAEFARPSTQASRYLFMPTLQGTGVIFEQLEYNPPNLTMFKAGTVPFFGDYVDVAGSPPFIPDGNGAWTYNSSWSVTPTAHAVWTDNRNVVGPPDGDWTSFVPLGMGGPSVFDPNATIPACDPDSDDVYRTGMRNQDIYSSRLTSGLYVAVPDNSRPLGLIPGTKDLFQRAFVIITQNNTYQARFFRIQIPVGGQPPGGQASFDQFSFKAFVDVEIEAYSSTSRTVFVTSTDVHASIEVLVTEIDARGGTGVLDGLRSSVLINPDPTNPYPADPNVLSREIYSPAVFNPSFYDDLTNPAVLNPAVLNPAVFNPAVFNPAVFNWNVENPAVLNPAVFNPAVLNPAVLNPAVFNPAVFNPAVFNPAVLNPAVFNPAVLNPAVLNPAVLNPAVFNPAVLNPAVLNPAVFNPAVFNPAVLNPAVLNPAVLNPAVFNTTFADGSLADFSYVAANEGNVSTAYSLNLSLPDPPTEFLYQLMVYRLYFLPVADGCTLTEAAHQELLINDNDPNLHADLLRPDGENSFELGPDEFAVITLRVIPNPDNPPNPNDVEDLLQDIDDDLSASVVACCVDTDEALTGETQPDHDVIGPLNIYTTALPYGVQGDAYSASLVATGGSPPYSWSLAPGSGAPPTGLTLNAAGSISGVPTVTGTFNITVQVSDGSQTEERALSIMISAFPILPLSQRNALIALYNSTNGDTWANNTNWKVGGVFNAPGTECTWYGVTCGSPSVVQIDLVSNNLIGSIPAELANLPDLKFLNLGDNQLIGGIPPELGNLSNLERLELFTNQLSGAIPPELGNLSNLEWLELDENQLGGSIPYELGQLANLQVLVLGENQLTGSIPPALGYMSSLRILGVFGNQLTGSIPPELGNLSNLYGLYLNENQLNGSIPSELGNLYNLNSLHLYDNQLTGSIPPQLLSLGNLVEIRLEHNQLSGSIPPELGNLPNLEALRLEFNEFGDGIPPELGDLSNLQWLSLGYNPLGGTIPVELADLTNLVWLYLAGNQLTGTIPPELGSLSNLETLDLDYNQLSGDIPSELGTLTNLEWLRLDQNQLAGNIPWQIGNLTNLNRLNLAGNQLEGPIPANLVGLVNLQDNDLDIRWNALYSEDPSLTSFLTSKQDEGDWQSSQTVAPSVGLPGFPTNESLTLDWAPIAFTGETGGYQVLYSVNEGGPYTRYPTLTADKSSSSLVVNGLHPGTSYFFVVRTITDPHTNNQNTVMSSLSYEVEGTTTGQLNILSEPTFAPPNGVEGVFYSHTLTAEWGSPPYSWSLVPGFGELPAGLTVSSAGDISGVPLVAGTYTFAVRVTDGTLSGEHSFTVSIAPPGGGVVFFEQPGLTTAGSPIPNFSAKVLDASGVPIPGVSINLSIATDPCGGSTLSPTLPSAVTNPAGIARFGTVSINRGGFGFTLRVSTGGGAPSQADSEPFGLIGFCETDTMSSTRVGATMTRLPDGRILVAGGATRVGSPSTPLASAEIYDPATEAWSATGDLVTARSLHTATLLPDGRVLVAGGTSSALPATGPALDSAEIYDSSGAGTFSSVGILTVPRMGHTASLLESGNVLIAGGRDAAAADPYLDSAEIFTTGGGGTFAGIADPMTSPRDSHRAVRLNDGRVLLVGGLSGPSTNLRSAEVFDSAGLGGAGEFSAVGDMGGPRINHTATLLNDGRVLVSGDTTAEIFDPEIGAGTFQSTDRLSPARDSHAAVGLESGNVLVTGGKIGSPLPLFLWATADLFDPSAAWGTGAFEPSHQMRWRRSLHLMETLADSTVLIAGGMSYAGSGIADAEIYWPIRGQTHWSRQIGSGSEDQVDGVTADTTGVYVVGSANGALPGVGHLGGTDAFIWKFDSSGTGIWNDQFGTPANDSAREVAVGNTGIYVVGYTTGAMPGQTSAGARDVFIRKESFSVGELWTRQFGTAAIDNGHGIAFDPSGIYIVGQTFGTLPGQTSSGDSDAFVRKYDYLGNEIWTRQFGTVAYDTLDDVAVDSSGVYVAGYTRGTLPGQTLVGDADAFVRRYDFNGNEIWTRQFGSVRFDRASSVAVGATGVHVAGAIDGPNLSFGYDAFVRTFNFAGDVVWTHQFESIGADTDNATKIAVDDSGLYVVGYAFGTLPGQISWGSTDGYIRKYDFAGNEIWTRQFGSSGNDSASSVFVTGSGVYVGGRTTGVLPGQSSAGSADGLLVRFLK